MSSPPPSAIPIGSSRTEATIIAVRQAAEAGGPAADPGRHQDVGAPEAAGGQRQCDSGGVEPVADVGREQEDARRGEQPTQRTSRRLRVPAIATASGPTNSSVTAIPSGSRSSALVEAEVHAGEA